MNCFEQVGLRQRLAVIYDDYAMLRPISCWPMLIGFQKANQGKESTHYYYLVS